MFALIELYTCIVSLRREVKCDTRGFTAYSIPSYAELESVFKDFV